MNVTWMQDGETHAGRLTTDHAASSYGLPVLLEGRVALGIHDVPPGTLLVPDGVVDAKMLEAARRAGWRVRA